MRLSPLDPYTYLFFALKAYGHVMLGEHDHAIDCLRQAVANNPDFPTPIASLAAMLALTGQEADARAMMKQYLTRSGTKTRTVAQLKSSSWPDNAAYLAFREKLYQGLRGAGMAEE
jgi:Tfp pilus assembly protein PilF